MALPSDLDIGRPCSSSVQPCVTTLRDARRWLQATNYETSRGIDPALQDKRRRAILCPAKQRDSKSQNRTRHRECHVPCGILTRHTNTLCLPAKVLRVNVDTTRRRLPS